MIKPLYPSKVFVLGVTGFVRHRQSRTSERKRDDHMTRRFVCFLLVAVMLANQGLVFAHVHHAADGPGPDGHNSRSHFHLGGHDDHSADHEATHSVIHRGNVDGETREHDGDLPSVAMPVGDHDANAIYCTETVALAQSGATPVIVPATCVWGVASLAVDAQSDDSLLRLGPIRGKPASIFDTACPIYLRTLSLRI